MPINDLENLHCPDKFESLNAEEHQRLKEAKFFSQIPMLNYTPLHLLKDNSLVRFRGMIQDMQDPEIYLQRYEVRKSDQTIRTQNGKYRDCLLLNPGEELVYESKNNVQGERRTFFVVSIPGLNDWASDYEAQSNRANIPEHSDCNLSNISCSNAKKRTAPSESMEVDDAAGFVTTISTCKQNDLSHKRQCTEENAKIEVPSSTRSAIGAEYLLNSPIPERPSKACMVKIYADFDAYTLNSVVDVIGFLSVNPALDGSNIDSEMYDIASETSINEIHAQNPPPSLIPRLHAIFVQSLLHHNPLLDERFLPASTKMANDMDLNMLSIQKDLRVLLSLCFFNDELAAEYMLSHLISTIYSRSEFQSIGKFSLNICNLPKELPVNYTKKVYEILEMLLPSSHHLPLTLKNLNTATFIPKKDYETNKLVSGLLQLAPHTHLVLDETQMEQGKLESAGVMAIQHLANLINHQQIKCNFQFYEIDYNVDVPVLVLSEGRSMLPNDFTLPIQCETESLEVMEESLKAARHYLQPERLNCFRRYLTKAKTVSFAMNPDDTEMIQQDFVEMRKSGIINSADDLHALLVLSRLLGIARGRDVFDKETWQLAKEMESKRKTRIQNLPQSNRMSRNSTLHEE